MSVIAIRWAYSRPIKNPVAKSILVFLCTHDFPGNKSFFKLKTICEATAYSERAVRDAINYLIEHGYLIKNERFADDGRKISNQYELMIDDQFVQEFCNSYDLSTPHRQEMPVPPAPDAGTHRQEVPDYKNNALSTKKKKSSCPTDKKSTGEKIKADEPLPDGHFLKTIESKIGNAVRHQFADSMDRKAETKCIVPFFGPGHPSWEERQKWEYQFKKENPNHH